MKIYKSESGRSMVEILGVLAIVGVLSVGSVWGLRMALDKNVSNEITHELTQRAVLISSLKQHGQEVNLDEFADLPFTEKYNVHLEPTDPEGFFSLTLSDVPDNVVQNIENMIWDLPYDIYVNGIQIYDYDFKTGGRKNPSSVE